MTRDELLLAALAAGATTTAGLMRSTGVKERSCRYGLSHLVAVGYAWSPERGCWRLTEAGRAIASALPSLLPAERPSAESVVPAVDEGGTATADETAEPDGALGTRAALWWALAGAIGAVLLALARRSAISPPSPPSAPPTVWPYDGWPIQ